MTSRREACTQLVLRVVGLQIRDKSLHDEGGDEGCTVDEKGADDGKNPTQVWIQLRESIPSPHACRLEDRAKQGAFLSRQVLLQLVSALESVVEQLWVILGVEATEIFLFQSSFVSSLHDRVEEVAPTRIRQGDRRTYVIHFQKEAVYSKLGVFFSS